MEWRRYRTVTCTEMVACESSTRSRYVPNLRERSVQIHHVLVLLITLISPHLITRPNSNTSIVADAFGPLSTAKFSNCFVAHCRTHHAAIGGDFSPAFPNCKILSTSTFQFAGALNPNSKTTGIISSSTARWSTKGNSSNDAKKTRQKTAKKRNKSSSRRRKKSGSTRKVMNKESIETANGSSPLQLETWRLYGILTHPDEDNFTILQEQQAAKHRKQKRHLSQKQQDNESKSTCCENHKVEKHATQSITPPRYSMNRVRVILSEALKDAIYERLRIKPADTKGLGSEVGKESLKSEHFLRFPLHTLDWEGDNPEMLSTEVSTSSSSSPSNMPTKTFNTSDNILVSVVRQSLDARKKLAHPQYTYVVDLTLTHIQAQQCMGLRKNQPGRTELIKVLNNKFSASLPQSKTKGQLHGDKLEGPKKGEDSRPVVLIVGAGPAGLFCALDLLRRSGGRVHPVILERGQPVEKRGKDIGALIHRRWINEESNFAFGEGGAGTWSDGKLTTRIGRNSEAVRDVLETLVDYGAPSNILWQGSPHLGTDNLVRLLRNMRKDLQNMGATFLFGTKMTSITFDPLNCSRIIGVQVERSPEDHKKNSDKPEENAETFIYGDATVLATGHSARDVYESLASQGPQEPGKGHVHDSILADSEKIANKESRQWSCLELKGFAVGFRIEHPQRLITQIQYGNEWGPTVKTGKARTDQINKDFFETQRIAQNEVRNVDLHNKKVAAEESDVDHPGYLPVPSYRLATDKAKDGSQFADMDGGEPSHQTDAQVRAELEGGCGTRGVYSFCMCPGGQIVPASTNASEVCVNGMSFSRRDSVWANSALVVAVSEDDPILNHYRSQHGILAGVEFQRDMERRAAEMGGGNWTVPVQRVTDFIEGKVSTTLPSSSYRLGVKSAPCHEIYPPSITNALRDALENHFERQMPGYVHPDALLHAVETRTSSPLRIARNSTTLQARGMQNLFPAGEGAGFAGGIVSAAVDGKAVAEAVLNQLYGSSSPSCKEKKSSIVGNKVGVSY